jgi:hypothetical protein
MKGEIKAIANTRISLSREEFEYYEKLRVMFGEDSFRGLFQTDIAGNIAGISPPLDRPTPQPILFFLLNVTFNQKMRQLEKFFDKIDSIEGKIKEIESKIL